MPQASMVPTTGFNSNLTNPDLIQKNDAVFVPPRPKQMHDIPLKIGVIGDTTSFIDASMSLVNKTKSHAAYNHGSMLGKRKTEHEFEYPSTPSPAYHHSTVRHPKQFNSAGGEGQVIQELEALTRENAALNREHNRAIRDSEGVSSEMVDDVIEMLALFGYHGGGSMEAEAQCAKLEQLGLVDGTITNDSDIFVFGGQHVYRIF